jgi:hypothetical protein
MFRMINEFFFVHKNHSVLIRQQRCRMTVSHFTRVVLKIIFSFSLILNVEFSFNLNSGNGIFSADNTANCHKLSVLTSSVEPRCCESIFFCFPSQCKLVVQEDAADAPVP